MPGLSKVRAISLMAHESEIAVPCVSQQKIRLDLRGVIVYKVGDRLPIPSPTRRAGSWIGPRPSSSPRFRTSSSATCEPSPAR